MADDDDAGETPECLWPSWPRRADPRGAAVGSVVGASLALVEATHAASPALATTLAWFQGGSRRPSGAGVSNAFAGCPSPSQLARGAARAAVAWLEAWIEPQTARGACLLLGSLASARRGALAGDAWAEVQPLVQAHAQSLSGGDDALTRAISRLAPERRTDLATALADCALAVDASSSSNAFQSIIAPIESVAQQACTQQADLELVLALYRGVATAAAAQALDGPGATLARRRPADAVARALGPLVDAVASLQDATLLQRCASSALSVAKDAASAHYPRVAPGEGPVAPSGAEMCGIMREGRFRAGRRRRPLFRPRQCFGVGRPTRVLRCVGCG